MSDRGFTKAVLITGAGGGIGVRTVAAFAERGYRVYAGVRSTAGIPQLDRTGVTQVELDVTDPATIRRALESIAAERGSAGLQVLVNNAGVIVQGPLELVPDEELHRQFDINVYGPQRVLKAALPLLRNGHGRVINISAATAQLAMPYLGPISASKAALESLSHAARVELAPWGIPVVIVEPGAAETPIFAKAEAEARKALALADPSRVALYRNQLAAVEGAMAKQKPGPVDRVVKAILRAAEARAPKACYVASRDARLLRVLSRLPLRMRDRLLAGSLGLAKVEPAVGAPR
ncbi:SDR family NAD(P)-dependent oxidoreductase [Saccharomonospora sp. NPDC046836]|uniref:SDR family NAD(P)-dependent oxidoreductase n=1 Tax=Saccharomonospora sp. NPDC046836 TaxID=3156921 RepID=UPI0033D24A61